MNTSIIYFLHIILWAAVCGFVVLDIFLGIKFLEYAFCVKILHQPPFVPSNNDARRIIESEIKKHYPNAQTVIEIGSGYGGLARRVAKNCNVHVTAVENMPFSAFVSRVCDICTGVKNKTVFCDAFKYLGETEQRFDIAVAYLGPVPTPKLEKYSDRFSVLISADFQIPNKNPVRVIPLKYGTTIYDRKKYPHCIYVYEYK